MVATLLRALLGCFILHEANVLPSLTGRVLAGDGGLVLHAVAGINWDRFLMLFQRVPSFFMLLLSASEDARARGQQSPHTSKQAAAATPSLAKVLSPCPNKNKALRHCMSQQIVAACNVAHDELGYGRLLHP